MLVTETETDVLYLHVKCVTLLFYFEAVTFYTTVRKLTVKQQ